MQMPVSTPAPEARVVPAGRGSEWIAQGFGLFRLQPGLWIALLITWMVIQGVFSAMSLDLVNSFLNPVFLAGILLGCDSQARGESLKFEHLFAGFKSGQLGQLLLSTVILMALGLALVVALVVALAWPLLGMLGDIENASPERIFEAIGLVRLLLLVLVVLLFACTVGMAVWFAPALIVFRKMPALEALKLSFVGCMRNWLPLLVYGLVALLVLLLALIPFGLGLLVAIPVLTASVYAGYRDIYPEPAA